MNIKANIEIALVFVCGCVIGLLTGMKWESRASSEILKETVAGLSAPAPVPTVVALSALRANQVEKAIEVLESQLDSQIMTLRDDETLRQSTRNLITASIKRAKEYRDKYPHKSGFFNVDRDVNAVLNKRNK